MPKNWYSRLWLVLFIVVGSIYLLVPTFFWRPKDANALPAVTPEVTPTPAAALVNTTAAAVAPVGTPPAKEPLPGWMSFFPKRRLRLGLDLVGGSHLALSVDTEEALRALAGGHR